MVEGSGAESVFLSVPVYSLPAILLVGGLAAGTGAGDRQGQRFTIAASSILGAAILGATLYTMGENGGGGEPLAVRPSSFEVTKDRVVFSLSGLF